MHEDSIIPLHLCTHGKCKASGAKRITGEGKVRLRYWKVGVEGDGNVVERNTGVAHGECAGCNRVSGVGDYGGTSNIKRPGTKRRSTTPDYPRCTALFREIDTRDAF